MHPQSIKAELEQAKSKATKRKAFFEQFLPPKCWVVLSARPEVFVACPLSEMVEPELNDYRERRA